jgi:cell division GTPase FtsZ
VRFCFVGVGQGGGRFAEAFYKLGYRRVCAINTSESDLSGISIPEENKFCIGTGGAAKTRSAGKEAVESRSEDILEFMRKCFGTEFDRIMVMATAGGGTGSGGFPVAVRLASDLVEDLRIDTGSEARVGLILATPPNTEVDRMPNALEALKDAEKLLKAKKLSPVLLLDNERIRDIYPTGTMGETWDKANLNIAGLFHTFNLLAGAPTQYDSFDEADYKSVLASGLITCGAMPVGGDLSASFRENVSKTVLMSGVDLSTAGIAACLLVGNKPELDALEWAAVQSAYSSLNRVVGGCTLHRGLYAAKRPVAAHTLIGGLSMPKARMDEITRLVNKEKDWDL